MFFEFFIYSKEYNHLSRGYMRVFRKDTILIRTKLNFICFLRSYMNFSEIPQSEMLFYRRRDGEENIEQGRLYLKYIQKIYKIRTKEMRTRQL